MENHATFRTLLRVLRDQPTPAWVAVGWVQGRNTAPLESLAGLPFSVTHMDYLGDLDAAGLQIASTACAVAQRAGISAGPATSLWELLLEQRTRAGSAAGDADARRLVAWLPGALRDRAYALLLTGRAIPQEALRYDVLTHALR